VTGLWLTGRSLTGIWPQPLISTVAPTMAVTIARQAPVFELLAHRTRFPHTDARSSFTVVLCHRLNPLPGSDKPALSLHRITRNRLHELLAPEPHHTERSA
jgi:cob(I)alamin adenosyltransferase